MLAALLLFLLVAAPVASAARAEGDGAYLEACLAAAGGYTDAARDTCFAQVSEVCVASSAGTTVDLITCAQREYDVWQALLDAAYRRLAEAEPAARLAKIDAAQEAWRTWRDQRCRVYATYEGSIYAPLAALCLAETVSRRVVDLWEIERGFVGE